jgi:zinc transporter
MTDSGARFIHNVVLDGRGGCTPVSDDGPAAAGDEQGTAWIHFDTSNPAALEWLNKESNIDPVICEALVVNETRPRSFTTDHGLFLILRGVNLNPGADGEDMVSIRLWIERHRIISSRRRRLLSVADLRTSLDAGHGPVSSGGFLVALIERLADRIGDFVDQIEEQLSETEEALSTSGMRGIRQRLSALRRQIAAVRRFLAPMRDALERLYRQPMDFVTSKDLSHIREETDRFARYLEDLDLARERAVVLQEELLGQMAQEQNSRMYVLSVVAAIFLPLTFITGLLGMNVGGLPGVETSSGFTGAVVSMTAATVVIAALLRWKKWI